MPTEPLRRRAVVFRHPLGKKPSGTVHQRGIGQRFDKKATDECERSKNVPWPDLERVREREGPLSAQDRATLMSLDSEIPGVREQDGRGGTC